MASFRKRENGKWEYRISYKTADGKYKEKSKGGFKTKKEAELQARKVQDQLENGLQIDDKITFEDFFIKYVESYKEQSVRSATYAKYLDTHRVIKTTWPNTPIAKMTPMLYQEGITKLGHHYAKATLEKIHHHIKSSLKVAIHEGLILRNFAELAKVSSQKEETPIEEKFLEKDEYQRLIQQLRPKTRYKKYMFLYLIAVSGMRYSEVRGLTWDDVDFKKQVFHIRKSWNDRIKDYDDLKNKHSKRDVPFTNETALLLKQFRVHHFGDKALVQTIQNREANNLLRKLVGRDVHLHSLRHTYASFLIFSGVDVLSVSRLLGHKDTTTTLKIYAHVLDEMKDRDHDKVKNIFASF